MDNSPSMKLIRYFTSLAKQVSMRQYDQIEDLFELTKEEKYPKVIAELAEAFGMMVVQVQAREFGLEQHIRDLKESNEALEFTKERLSDSLKKLKTASLETIYRLSRAAEYKDDNTSAHIERMSHYSAAIARCMNLPDKTVEAILYASPMHDIGKIGIPDHILLKTGPLNSEEWEIMKSHTLIGASILEGSSSEIIQAAEIIALSHHEKWDGSGYPKGLRGEEIPLFARIVSLADVFDALTSQRPYKEAISVGEAFEFIDQGRGRYFDPRIVDAFFGIEEEVVSIAREFSC